MKSMIKPNPMIEKTISIICALKGYKSTSWTTARDFLARPSAKAELMECSPSTLRAEDVLRA
jgi:hypothetical protein